MSRPGPRRELTLGSSVGWCRSWKRAGCDSVVLFVLAAVVVGFSKTAIGGLGAVAVAIFASLLARTSTAAVLLVYLVGDLFAIWHYRREFDWPLVRSLPPTVIPGLALGAAFLAVVDDATLRRSIGALILLTVVLQLWLSHRGSRAALVHGRAGTAATGLAASFTTMTANAAGGGHGGLPRRQGRRKRQFVGTVAWFFFRRPTSPSCRSAWAWDCSPGPTFSGPWSLLPRSVSGPGSASGRCDGSRSSISTSSSCWPPAWPVSLLVR